MQSGTPRPPVDQVPFLGDLTQQATVVKCMGRTYTAATCGDAVQLNDVTDPTHPLPLGTAHPAPGAWEVHDRSGKHVTNTGDLLDALALLREHQWAVTVGVGPGRR
ncbi:hypothetical protein ACIRBX_22660 [Kitasatospora sp. NPDC096147]|uniref:hypothetical protein n=1 Tax=Kitasatospora sp. NPDC096147 TaxID=3364093 RepID=UPI00381C321A